MYIINILLVLFPGAFASLAQQSDTIVIQRNDTIIEFIQPGTPLKQLNGRKLEDILEDYSDRNIFSQKLHEWLVKSSFDQSMDQNPPDDLSDLAGKNIVNIDIRHVPPFGGSVNDTNIVADSWLAKLGNNLRFETASRVILKTITFSKNDKIDAVNISDSERLLRNLSFVNDVRIRAWPHPGISDAVNISIYIQDRYPHAITVGMTDDAPRISLVNKNLLGRGLNMSHTLAIPSSRINEWGFRETLGAENFLGQYIDFEIDYSNTNSLHHIGSKVERKFVLPELKYAGGAIVNRSFRNQKIEDYPATEWEPPLSFRRQNFWLGRSFLLDKNNSPFRSNIYFLTRYMDLSIYNRDESHAFIPTGKFYYTGFAFSRQEYFKNNLIYSFGRTEDVPFGSLSSLSLGFHQGQKDNRYYMSIHHSFGKALAPSRGYLYFRANIGSFFNSGKPEQGHIKLGSEYISPLITVGNSMLRNFLEIEYLNGLNRLPGEYLYIDESVNGLHRFDYSKDIRGSEKIVLKTEQVFFTGAEPLGFKFAIFSFFDMAFLREKENISLIDQKPYFSFGGGLRIRNDNLVFNTLQIRFSIMPRVPEGEFPMSLRITGESTRNFRDFVPSQPGNAVFY